MDYNINGCINIVIIILIICVIFNICNKKSKKTEHFYYKGGNHSIQSGGACDDNDDCANSACARQTAADGETTTCCPSGDYGRYPLVFGPKYCTNMPSGSTCWTDAQCASGSCSSPLGLKKGICANTEYKAKCDALYNSYANNCDHSLHGMGGSIGAASSNLACRTEEEAKYTNCMITGNYKL